VADGGRFDFEQLHRVTKVVTKNLNKVIDRNYYTVDAWLILIILEEKSSNSLGMSTSTWFKNGWILA